MASIGLLQFVFSLLIMMCVFPDEDQGPVQPHATMRCEHQAHVLSTENPLPLTPLSA